MNLWNGPAYKVLAKSEIGGRHGHTSGIVPVTATQSFFGTPMKKETHIISRILVEFDCGDSKDIIKTNIHYFSGDTHGHIHITGNICPLYTRKYRATPGDVILFWKSSVYPNLFRAELIKKGSTKWKTFEKEFSGFGGFLSKKIDTLSERISESEAAYQTESVVDTELNDSDFPPEKKLSFKKTSVSKIPPRNKAKGDYVLKKNKYKCQIDSDHVTFISRSGNQYMEKHHLIPLEFYELFDYNIDDINNIVSLCPVCHRKVHHAKTEESEKIIESLWEQQNEKLKSSSIGIELNRLKKFYFRD